MREVKGETKNGNETRSVQIDRDVTVTLKRANVVDEERSMILLTMGVKRIDVVERPRERKLRKVSRESDISSTMIGVRVRSVTILWRQIMMKSRKKSSYRV